MCPLWGCPPGYDINWRLHRPVPPWQLPGNTSIMLDARNFEELAKRKHGGIVIYISRKIFTGPCQPTWIQPSSAVAGPLSSEGSCLMCPCVHRKIRICYCCIITVKTKLKLTVLLFWMFSFRPNSYICCPFCIYNKMKIISSSLVVL